MSRLSGGAKAGIAVGVVLAALIILAISGFLIRRLQHTKHNAPELSEHPAQANTNESRKKAENQNDVESYTSEIEMENTKGEIHHQRYNPPSEYSAQDPAPKLDNSFPIIPTTIQRKKSRFEEYMDNTALEEERPQIIMEEPPSPTHETETGDH